MFVFLLSKSTKSQNLEFSNSFSYNVLVELAIKCLFFVSAVLLHNLNIYQPRKLAQHIVTYFHEIPISTCVYFEIQEAVFNKLASYTLSLFWWEQEGCLHPDVCKNLFASLCEYLSAFCFWRHSGNSTRSLPCAVFVGLRARKKQKAQNAEWEGRLFKRYTTSFLFNWQSCYFLIEKIKKYIYICKISILWKRFFT